MPTEVLVCDNILALSGNDAARQSQGRTAYIERETPATLRSATASSRIFYRGIDEIRTAYTL